MKISSYFGSSRINSLRMQNSPQKKHTTSVSFRGNDYDEHELYPKEMTKTLDKWMDTYYKARGVGLIANKPDNLSDIIPNFKSLNDNKKIFMGGVIPYIDDPSNLKHVKDAQISRIIDLRGNPPNSLAAGCWAYDIDYVSYPMPEDSYWKQSIFCNYNDLCNEYKQDLVKNNHSQKEIEDLMIQFKAKLYNEQKEFVKSFADLINTLKEGNCQIGCVFADIRTPALMSLITRIDNMTYGYVNDILPMSELYADKFKNFIDNLTKENKAKLNITEGIESLLRSSIQRAKIK